MTAPLFSVPEMPRTISEAQLQIAAEEHLTLRHYRWCHYHKVFVNGRWLTPVKGSRGLPDLIVGKSGRPPVFVEVKAHRGVLEPEQELWASALGEHWFLLRPETWPAFVARFR